jgi:hypothetical protein
MSPYRKFFLLDFEDKVLLLEMRCETSQDWYFTTQISIVFINKQNRRLNSYFLTDTVYQERILFMLAFLEVTKIYD